MNWATFDANVPAGACLVLCLVWPIPFAIRLSIVDVAAHQSVG